MATSSAMMKRAASAELPVAPAKRYMLPCKRHKIPGAWPDSDDEDLCEWDRIAPPFDEEARDYDIESNAIQNLLALPRELEVAVKSERQERRLTPAPKGILRSAKPNYQPFERELSVDSDGDVKPATRRKVSISDTDEVHLVENLSRWYSRVEERQELNGSASQATQKRYATARAEREAEEREQKRRREEEEREARERIQLRMARTQKFKQEILVRIRRDSVLAVSEMDQQDADREEQTRSGRRKEQMNNLRTVVNRKIIEDGSDGFTSDKHLIRRLEHAMRINDPNAIVIEDKSISRKDLGTLYPRIKSNDESSGWLNDAIINTTLIHLVEAANKQLGHDPKQHKTPAPFWAFSSAWYKTIGGETGHLDGARLERWSKKRGVNLSGTKLLQARKILFPVCQNSHWTVTIVDAKKRTIETLNSMQSASHNRRIEEAVRAWLQFELKGEYHAAQWHTYTNQQSGQQTNGSDCGVFTIMNSIARVKNIPTESMRRQVRPSNIARYRVWLAALLFAGGFDNGSKKFPLHLEHYMWEGAPEDDPDYN